MLVDLLPAHIRKIVYAVLAMAVPVVTIVFQVAQDGWQSEDFLPIFTAVVASSGFTMAAANTNTGVEA